MFYIFLEIWKYSRCDTFEVQKDALHKGRSLLSFNSLSLSPLFCLSLGNHILYRSHYMYRNFLIIIEPKNKSTLLQCVVGEIIVIIL